MQTGGVTVDVCHHGCGGIWFDAFELKKVQAATQTQKEVLLTVPRSPTASVDYTAKRMCPRCITQPMIRRYYNRERTTQIDECPACGGHWLDHGEWERIVPTARPVATSKPAEQSDLNQLVNNYLAGLKK